MNFVPFDPLGNRLLASLPREDFLLLAPHLQTGSLMAGSVLVEPGDEIAQVYFPSHGMISLLTVMEDGRAIETATVGRDGIVGAASAFGSTTSTVRATVQVQTRAAQIAAAPFRAAVAASQALQKMCIGDTEMLLLQARVNASCHALHPIEARFGRLLLETAETSGSDAIALTQEALSDRLGVRRTSITEAAHRLRAEGIIRCGRGMIRIIDRKRLAEAACECVRTLHSQKAKAVR
jgi:CRP-like cAMP-binding protein